MNKKKSDGEVFLVDLTKGLTANTEVHVRRLKPIHACTCAGDQSSVIRALTAQALCDSQCMITRFLALIHLITIENKFVSI